jgi:hypothetical protein
VESILAIVEVKGCWNGELLSAMENQLRDRYLVDNGTKYGLYAVGWYAGDQWDPSDPRSKATPTWNLQEAQRRLDEEAARLSSETVLLKAVVINCGLH